MSAHTPGQLPEAAWLAGDGSQAWSVIAVRSWPTLNAKRYTTPLFTADQMRAYAADEVERSGAPEMLAALQLTLNVLDATGASYEANIARAAIAKATGADQSDSQTI